MDIDQPLNLLREAQDALELARRAEYTALRVRDAAMVEAHRAGASSNFIGEITRMNQPNVACGRRRAVTRRQVIPSGYLGPSEARRASGLPVKEFVRLVESGELPSIEISPGVHAFRPEAVKRQRSAG